ncbi:hypothetical protein J1605_013193 [Eschrichtius robustus]|uniref:Uncharacterized protein n=1 Tax=Eschrichtius robustus TaxID=9764 RepID=A0AB34GHN3_ESCRO|nr:hypothetical protein J1605_013193 [Eschrichtius robustus]
MGKTTPKTYSVKLSGTKDIEKTPSGDGQEKYQILKSGHFTGILFFLITVSMKYVLDSTTFLIGVAVAHAPEGLLVIVTVTPLMTEKQVAKNCLEMNLEAVKTSVPPLSFALTRLTLRLTTEPMCGVTIRSMWLTHDEQKNQLLA